MRQSITLYHLEREDIKVDIVARFARDKLVIDGYDIGRTVEEVWGDSDYEYVLTLPAESVARLYALLGVAAGDRRALLKALEARFGGHRCFSAIREWLDEHDVPYESFTWT